MRRFIPRIDAEYRRVDGTHTFATYTGEQVSVVSAPTWESYLAQLEQSKHLGKLALSPELITSPGRLEDIPGKRALIEERTAQVQGISAQRPETVFALGTATFKEGHKPANSLVYIKAGEVIAQTNKLYTGSPQEHALFTLQSDETMPRTPQLPNAIGALVCSDLLFAGARSAAATIDLLTHAESAEPMIPPEATLAIMSSCWASPLKSQTQLFDMAFKEQLEYGVGRLFQRYATLQDVIVADRLPEGSTLPGPYNCQFTRPIPM